MPLVLVAVTSKLDETLDVQQREFGVYPLWICPMRIFKEDAGFIKPTAAGEEMFVDVGIYGVPTVSRRVAGGVCVCVCVRVW